MSATSAASLALWSRVKQVPVLYPFTFGVVVSGLKTSFSDFLVQKVVEQKEKIDWKRNAAFAAFGFIYLGGIQYCIYVPIFGRMFPGAASFAAKSVSDKLKDAKGLFHLTAQVFLDQCLHHPFMYFPAFYCTKELVMHEKPDIARCLREYQRNMKEDLLALWKIWVPATLVNFAFMPMHLRIPCVACTSLLWTCILSAMRGGDVTHGETMAGGAVTGATLTMMEESLDELFTSSVQLERDMDHIILTASGPDRPGLVALLTRAVADAGGNVTHSKMVRLGQDFIMLLHVSIAPDEQRKLVEMVKEKPKLKPLNVQCSPIARRQTGTYEAAVMGVRLRCVGPDRPGMLASISESLESAGLSIENVTTELTRRGKVLDFVVQADCVTTRYMNKDEIEDMVANLNSLKQKLQLDVVDLRVQRLIPHRE